MLSGGQRQRIGLARALYGDPKLLVLDEPNASLDNEGEVALLQAMAHLKKMGATVVIITHKVSLLSGVDKLMIMNDGAIAAFGPREGVLQRLLEQQKQLQQKPQQPQPQVKPHMKPNIKPQQPQQPQQPADRGDAGQSAVSGEEVPRG